MQLQQKLHLNSNYGCHNIGIEIIDISPAYHLELLELNKNLYSTSRHIYLSYVYMVLRLNNKCKVASKNKKKY